MLALEWGPRDEVLDWADQVMREHPERLGILVTHAYLNHNDRRYDHTDQAHSQGSGSPSEHDSGRSRDGQCRSRRRS